MKQSPKKEDSKIKKEAKRIELYKKVIPPSDIKAVYLESLVDIESLLDKHFEEE